MSDDGSGRRTRIEVRAYEHEKARANAAAKALFCSLSEFVRMSMNTCAAEFQEGADLFDRRRSSHPVIDERRESEGRRAYD